MTAETAPRARATGPAPGIVRASGILHEIARHDAQTISGLAANLRLAKSTTTDVCGALVDHQLLTRDAAGAYHLGALVDRLAASWVGGGSALRRFARVCDAEPGLAGDTVSLSVPTGTSVVCVAVRLGTRPLAQTPRPGTRAPLETSPAGRALLAAVPAPALAGLLRAAAAFDGEDPDALVERVALLAAATPPPGGALAVGATRAGGWVVVRAHLPDGSPGDHVDRARACVARVAGVLTSEALDSPS